MNDPELSTSATPVLSRSMWCQRCFQAEPDHFVWMKVRLSKHDVMTVAQAVCDRCLEAAVTSLELSRVERGRMGQKCGMVSIAGLEDPAG